MEMSKQNEREEFETWYEDNKCYCDTANESTIALNAWQHRQSRIDELEEELEVDAGTIDLMSKLLARIAISLKGEELALHRHGYHDLPDLVESLQAELTIAVDALEKFNINGNYEVHRQATEALSTINKMKAGE
jgi:hypothetical protein